MATRIDQLELKVPPLAVVLICAGLMWLTARLLPVLPMEPAAKRAGLLLLIPLAVIFAAGGALSFLLARTTANPIKPETASSLVSGGIYRFSRNPMYMGMLLLLIEWAWYLASPFALAFCLAFVLYMNRFQIQPEERALQGLFGEDYSRYCEQVRRWL